MLLRVFGPYRNVQCVVLSNLVKSKTSSSDSDVSPDVWPIN